VVNTKNIGLKWESACYDRFVNWRSLFLHVFIHYFGYYFVQLLIVAGMYAPFVRDWLAVFPHMKIYRTEDYHTNRSQIFAEILQYIELGEFRC
jgi:hypothetical protein